MEEAPVKLVAVQHSSQYSALRYYHLVHKRRGAASFSGKCRDFLFNALALPVKRLRARRLQKSLFRELAALQSMGVLRSEGNLLTVLDTPALEKLLYHPSRTK